MYRFDEDLECFISDDAPTHHSKRTTNRNDIDETSCSNDGVEIDIPSALRARHPYVQ